MTAAFGTWLAQQAGRDDVVGAVARTVVAEVRRRWVAGASAPQSPAELRACLKQSGASDSQLSALARATSEWARAR